MCCGKPQDSDTTVRCVSAAFGETIAWAVLCEECGDRDVEQESSMEFFGFYDIFVKIITTWLKTREGLTKRHVQHDEEEIAPWHTNY
jgi:hypothetical protein